MERETVRRRGLWYEKRMGEKNKRREGRIYANRK
jgi:hypothetical protein